MSKKKFFIGSGLGIFFILLFNWNIYPYLWNNGVSIVFNNNTTESTSKVSSDYLSFETMIVQGAGYYLESNTVFQDLLNKIENKDILGTDYEGWIASTDKSKELIDHAIDLYCQLINKAEITPYNDLVLEALAQFDYDSYLVKNSLNNVVFSTVKELLLQGDAIGLLKVNYKNLTEISNLLIILQDQLKNQNLTDYSIVLEINEKYSESMLFGSYTARVLSEIH